MCGIVGGVATIQIKDILYQGLQKLEYRGYDSAGIALMESDGELSNIKAKGKVSALEKKLDRNLSAASTGIAHTRWATHGRPSKKNSHPHLIENRLAVVHNGIIENYQEIKNEIVKEFPETKFISETDTEVAAWYIYYQVTVKKKTLNKVIQQLPSVFEGSYALALIDKKKPSQLFAIRKGSPLIFGKGRSGLFIASDPIAVFDHIESMAIIEEGCSVHIDLNHYTFFDSKGREKKVTFEDVHDQYSESGKGHYKHHMHKEIHEQPEKIEKTLRSYSNEKQIHFYKDLEEKLTQVKSIHCVACGTSYYALFIACYWIEEICGIPCKVEVASEFRYRESSAQENSLFLTISQSGETADSLAALEKAKESKSYLTTLAICNCPQSSMVRNADYSLITSAGIEVSVASTKAFTSQLALLFLLALKLSKNRKKISKKERSRLLKELYQLPEVMSRVLKDEKKIMKFSKILANKSHAIFLGRGSMFPLAQEGALKLKELSYIYAEAYPAGELKHGPLALIDEKTPVIVVSPPTQTLKKLHSNMEEVQARGGVMLVFLDEKQKIKKRDFDEIIKVPYVDYILSPMIYILPLQILAYQVAVLKGTDLDQPRNLAKSVTVE